VGNPPTIDRYGSIADLHPGMAGGHGSTADIYPAIIDPYSPTADP